MAAEETLSEPSYLHIKGEGHTVLKSCFIKICVCKNVSFSQFFHAIKLMTNDQTSHTGTKDKLFNLSRS